jgi:hypothetical protein
MRKDCSILLNSQKSLQTDHNTIFTSIQVHTQHTQKQSTPVGTRKYQVEKLQDPTTRSDILQLAQQLSTQLENDIDQLVSAKTAQQQTASALVDKFTTYCDKAAEKLKKPNILPTKHHDHKQHKQRTTPTANNADLRRT